MTDEEILYWVKEIRLVQMLLEKKHREEHRKVVARGLTDINPRNNHAWKIRKCNEMMLRLIKDKYMHDSYQDMLKEWKSRLCAGMDLDPMCLPEYIADQGDQESSYSKFLEWLEKNDELEKLVV